MTQEIIDRVRTIAEPIVLNEGMELVDIEYRREAGGWVLRLIIDKRGGVTLDDCVRISQETGRSLDIEDFISNRYRLEVSSPGLDRPLKKERDFINFSGRSIRVKTVHPVGNQKTFSGRLIKCEAGQIEMETEGGTVQIPLSNIARANLEVEY